MKKWIKVLLALLSSVLVIVLCYVGYVVVTYYRIPDNTAYDMSNNQSAIVETNKDYTIQTYNIGFGAYNHEFSFFMDSGEMVDGKKVNGKMGKAKNKDVVLENTNGAIEVSKKDQSDFYMFQEVDTDSTRSYKVNQYEMISEAFKDYGSVFVSNFHSAFLAYPLNDFHGASNAGLVNLSKYAVSENIRKQYTIDMSFPYKYMDLDRCFVMSRIKIANGKELVLINSHMSAYDAGGLIREKQLKQLNDVLASEYEKGNYVIVGGDFNHDIAKTVGVFKTEQKQPAWVFSLNDENLTDGYNIVQASNKFDVATCRSTDLPYVEGVNYRVVLDGFIISDNIVATAENINSNFDYSDHNPVVMTFKLVE